MKVVLAYVYPNIGNKHYDDCVRRFCGAYVRHPPGQYDHELYVVVNGRELTSEQENLFSPLVPAFIQHDNSGRDVGAHRLAAANIPCDLIVCLGTPCWPARAGWLDRIVQVFEDRGPGLYGNYCFHQPAPHVRTTFWWGSPQIINSHTLPVDDGLRYEFEHGSRSITRHCMALGFPVLQVTWNHVYDIANWTHVTEKEAMVFDQHTERIHYGF